MRKKLNRQKIAERPDERIVISDSRQIAQLLNLRARIEGRLRSESAGNAGRTSVAPINTP
jgi:hypothetical protein